MSYRYYGGTRERSIEQDMADLKWVTEHSSDASGCLDRMARGFKVRAAVHFGLLLLLALTFIALIGWGIWAVINSGFSWQLVLFNPITFVFFAVVGLITAVTR